MSAWLGAPGKADRPSVTDSLLCLTGGGYSTPCSSPSTGAARRSRIAPPDIADQSHATAAAASSIGSRRRSIPVPCSRDAVRDNELRPFRGTQLGGVRERSGTQRGKTSEAASRRSQRHAFVVFGGAPRSEAPAPSGYAGKPAERETASKARRAQGVCLPLQSSACSALTPEQRQWRAGENVRHPTSSTARKYRKARTVAGSGSASLRARNWIKLRAGAVQTAEALHASSQQGFSSNGDGSDVSPTGRRLCR